MPRPREIGPGEIIATKLSVEDAKLFKEIALRRGVTPSRLLREIVLNFLKGEKARLNAAHQTEPSPPLLSAQPDDPL